MENRSPLNIREASIHFLTNDPSVNDYWPCFSPDGKDVLFSRITGIRDTAVSPLETRISYSFSQRKWELFLVPSAGGKARPFFPSPLSISATKPSWSKRLNMIAFTGTSADGNNAVWLVNADGTQPHHLGVDGLSEQVLYPSWFQDGKRLAVMDAAEQVIKVIDCERFTASVVTKHEEVLTGMPSVSPDGEWIAFAGQKNLGQSYDQAKNSIWLVNLFGELRTVEVSPGQGRTPAWSPDGEWLAFESKRGNSDQLYAAFIIGRDGTGLRQITPYKFNANHPVWSPNAKCLVFSAYHTEGSNATGIALVDVSLPANGVKDTKTEWEKPTPDLLGGQMN